MPPCAAFECERTGWTFARMPTDTPSSAAASAARCPARPAPITSTSWEGILVAVLLERRRLYGTPSQTLLLVYACRGSGELRERLERARDLLDRHDAAQHALGVDRHDRSQ